MKYFKYSISLSLFTVLLLMLLQGCVKKDDFYKENTKVESNRKALVKIIDAPEILRARDVTPTIDTFLLFQITRDVNSQSDLSQPMTVKLTKNTQLVTSNGFTELPANAYTLLTDINNVTFQPGEFAKDILIRVNKANLDLSQQYALAYTISEVGSGGMAVESQKEVLVQVIVKNKYDGHYRLTGTMVDLANAALTGAYPIEVDLETVGPNSVVLNPTQGPFAYGYLYPIMNNGAGSGYGSFTPVFTFDANDNVISVENAYGQPAGNGRSAELDPSGVNKWFASDRHMEVKYWMNQPSVLSPHRVTFNEKYTYLGPR